MKKVLIISPYFPPYNTPDLQRLRMSLPYFESYGWTPEVVTVLQPDQDTPVDELLNLSVPSTIKVHYVNTFSKKLTAKVGLGSIALRSIYFYKKKVSDLLRSKDYALVFFTTTQFPLCTLGAYWKKKFKVPYVIDMQDPWYNDYYEDKPKSLRPKKYWFSSRLNKYLEPIAMKHVDGIMSVSQKYIDDLKQRYENVRQIPTTVITFGYAAIDYEIAKNLPIKDYRKDKLTLAYVGVLGSMMDKSLSLFFEESRRIENFEDRYDVVFKGTSYANASSAIKTALPLAEKIGLTNVREDTNRLGIFEVLSYLSNVDGLLIFGTDDAGYTSSKLYPYLQTGKPILGIFHPQSNAIQILSELTNAFVIKLTDSSSVIRENIAGFLTQIDSKDYKINQEGFAKYSAKHMTEKQCELFNTVTDQQ